LVNYADSAELKPQTPKRNYKYNFMKFKMNKDLFQGKKIEVAAQDC
jgi:hypothetical protein